LSVSAISKRYAKALVSIGAEQQMVERFSEELAALRGALSAEKFLRLILESPTFPLQKKSAILSDLIAALKFSDGMRNFLGLLLEKDRLQYLGQIEGDYRALADDLSGTMRATVHTAAELTGAQQDDVRKALEKQTGKKVVLSVAVDPELIGGIQVEIGGKLFDGSLATQLKRIEETLKKG